LLRKDYDSFKIDLAKNPASGDLIIGTGGIRKTRLKSSSKGKSGGFRVCYLDVPQTEELFLILIYPKNEREDLAPEEKKILKELVKQLKGNKK